MDKYTKIILTVIAVSMFKMAFFEIKPIDDVSAELYHRDFGINMDTNFKRSNSILDTRLRDIATAIKGCNR